MLVAGAVALAVRAALGAAPHSGQAVAPMHGDFEAQRHWMEVTTALPPRRWYVNDSAWDVGTLAAMAPDARAAALTPRGNDVLYWGLDYPPLTAYHAAAAGAVAHALVPDAVAWGASWGAESPAVKAFMRTTVLAADAAVYLPAAAAAAAAFLGVAGASGRAKGVAFAFLALQPGLLLVDHGHFQYNGVALGLTLAALVATGRGAFLRAAALFAAALNYKQMTLYFAPVFFVAMLAAATRRRVLPATWSPVAGVAALGAVMVAVFAALWLPLCTGTPTAAACGDVLAAVLRRQFPFSRNLFEDKVSNLWCVAEPLLRLRARLYSPAAASVRSSVLIACAALTAALAAVPCATLWRHARAAYATTASPTGSRSLHRSLAYAAFAVSLAFFLASYQVHEKTILLPAAAAALLARDAPLFAVWFQALATVSMWPLLAAKDGLALQLVAVTVPWVAAFWPTTACVEATDGAAGSAALASLAGIHASPRAVATFLLAVTRVTLAAPIALALCAATLSPPAALPDLFSYASAVACCAAFVGALAWATAVHAAGGATDFDVGGTDNAHAE